VVPYQVFVEVATDTGISSKSSKSVKLAARMEAYYLLPSVAELAAVLASNSNVTVAMYAVVDM
jgi:hypothetical protein